MRRATLSVLVALALSTGAVHPGAASPVLVCDPNPGAEWYEIRGLPDPLDGSRVAAGKDGALALDLAQFPAGTSRRIRVKACRGSGCSRAVSGRLSRTRKVSTGKGFVREVVVTRFIEDPVETP